MKYSLQIGTIYAPDYYLAILRYFYHKKKGITRQIYYINYAPYAIFNFAQNRKGDSHLP
jgi:hypothetical protein